MMAGTGRQNIILIAWVAMFLNILNWRLRDVVAGQSVGDFWDIYRIGLALLASIITVFFIMQNSERLSRALSLPMILLLIYSCVALLSASLVISKVSFYSMWKAIELMVVTAVCLAILTHPKPAETADKALKYILGILSLLLCIWIIEAIIWPHEAFITSRGVIPYIMRGVMPIAQQNGLAFYSALVALFCVVSLYEKNRKKIHKFGIIILLLIALTELILSQSRTSFIGLLVAVLVFLFFSGKKKHLAVVLFISFITLVIWGASGLLLDYLKRGQEEELILTLSGRTIAWSRAIELFKESPIFGYGFVAAARVNILGSVHGGGMSTLHGALFDVIVGTGLLGLIPWLFGILIVIQRMLRISAYSLVRKNMHLRIKHAAMMALLSLIMVRSTTSSGLAIHDHTYMFFLAVLMYVGSINDRIRRFLSDRSISLRDHKTNLVRRGGYVNAKM